MTIAAGRSGAVVVPIGMVVAVLHRVMAGGVPRHAQLALRARAADWAQHRCSHRSA